MPRAGGGPDACLGWGREDFAYPVGHDRTLDRFYLFKSMMSKCPRQVIFMKPKNAAVFDILIWRFPVTALQEIEYQYISMTCVLQILSQPVTPVTVSVTPLILLAYTKIYILFRCLNSLFLI